MAAVAIGAAMAPKPAWRPLLIAGAICAAIPDLDALPRLFGGHDVAALGGHRGFTHSIAFAVLTGLAVAAWWKGRRRRVFAYIFLATLSHGVLDAFSNFGRSAGVGFLMPFASTRFSAPWQPIRSELSELAWCLLPLTCIAWLGLRVRGRRFTAQHQRSVRPSNP
jgi:inner membrane protein